MIRAFSIFMHSKTKTMTTFIYVKYGLQHTIGYVNLAGKAAKTQLRKDKGRVKVLFTYEN